MLWVCVFLFLFLCKYKFSVDAFFCLFFVVAPIPRQLCCVRVLVRVVSTNITNSPTIIWTTWLLRHHLVLHLCIIFVSCPLQQTPHSPYTKRFFCVFPVEQHGFFCPRWTTWYHVSDEFIWSISIIYLFLLSPFGCCCCWLLGCIGRRKKRRNMVHADVNAFLFLLFALSNDSCATKYRPRVFSSTHLRVYWWYGAQVGVTLQMVVCLFYMQPRAMCTTLKSGRGRQAAEQEEWMKNNTENATQKQQRWVPRKSILCANVWRTFNWKKHCIFCIRTHIQNKWRGIFMFLCVCSYLASIHHLRMPQHNDSDALRAQHCWYTCLCTISHLMCAYIVRFCWLSLFWHAQKSLIVVYVAFILHFHVTSFHSTRVYHKITEAILLSCTEFILFFLSLSREVRQSSWSLEKAHLQLSHSGCFMCFFFSQQRWQAIFSGTKKKRWNKNSELHTIYCVLPWSYVRSS